MSHVKQKSKMQFNVQYNLILNTILLKIDISKLNLKKLSLYNLKSVSSHECYKRMMSLLNIH